MPEFSSNKINNYAIKIVKGLASDEVCKKNCKIATRMIEKSFGQI